MASTHTDGDVSMASLHTDVNTDADVSRASPLTHTDVSMAFGLLFHTRRMPSWAQKCIIMLKDNEPSENSDEESKYKMIRLMSSTD